MSKKTFLFFIIIILLVAGGVGWYFIMGQNSTSPSEEGTPSDENLFPFGQNNSGAQKPTSGQTTGTNQNNDSTSQINQNSKNPRLKQISNVPTSGIVTFNVGSSTVIRYVERATGHIYEAVNNAVVAKKISSVTLPKIYEVLWSENGSRLIFRYLKDENDTIKTFSAKLSATSSPEEAIEGTFLSDNIKNISLLGNKIYYENESDTGSVGITANLDGSGKTSVFTSSFADWISKWTSPTGVTLYSRPSGIVLGAAYILNPTTGTYVKVAGGLNGLQALGNNDGNYVLVSFTQNKSLNTSIVNVKTSTIESLGVSTLIDKCVWGKKQKNIVYCGVPILPPEEIYPDSWYRGKVSFSDSIWKIDVSTGETTEIVNPLFESDTTLDITNMGISHDDSTLVFINKKDQSSWSYTLSN